MVRIQPLTHKVEEIFLFKADLNEIDEREDRTGERERGTKSARGGGELGRTKHRVGRSQSKALRVICW